MLFSAIKAQPSSYALAESTTYSGSITPPSLDPHQIVVFMYGPSGDKDLELANVPLNIPYAVDNFLLAGANFKSSYYGFFTGSSQCSENSVYDFKTTNIYDTFKNAGYLTGAIGYWPYSVKPNVHNFNNTNEPVTILSAASDFIEANSNNKFFLTIQFPRIDINFIPGVEIDSTIKCRGYLPPWQNTCIEQVYGTSVRWGIAQTNQLIQKLGNNASIVWFPATPATDPSVHENSDPKRSNRGLINSLYGLEMPLRSTFRISCPEEFGAIDLFPTLAAIAGLKIPLVDGINLLDTNCQRTKEMCFFTPSMTLGKCLFNSPAYARITNINGTKVFQTWDATRNLAYPLTDRFKEQPLRISLPKPIPTSISIPGCQNYPNQPLETFAKAPTNPKIISVILLDDMNLLYQLATLAPELTPVFNNGIVFSNFHGWVICSPARAQLLTSRSPMNKFIGMFGVYADAPGKSVPKGMPKHLGARGKISFLPQFFKQNGRITILSGKEHVSGGNVPSEFYGFTPGNIKCYDCLLRPGQNFNQFTDNFPEQAADLIIDHSIEKIDLALSMGKNVFDYQGHKTMHTKIQVGPNGLNNASCTEIISDIKGTPRFNYPAPYRTQLALAKIFAKAFMRYMQYLEEKAPNNHIVILTADNGPESRVFSGAENALDSSSRLLGPHIDIKRGLGEGGHRVDAVFFGLGKRGVLSDLTSSIDIYPTLIELSGDTSWQPFDRKQFEGVSLAPLIFSNDRTNLQNRNLFIERRGPEHSDFIKTAGRYNVLQSDQDGEWRLILGTRHKTSPQNINHFSFIKLYNLRLDPEEFNNVADLYPNKVKELINKFKKYHPYSSNSFTRQALPQDTATDSCRNYRISYPC